MLAGLALVLARPAVAQDKNQHWVATWASAQQAGRAGGPARAGGPPAAAATGQVGTVTSPAPVTVGPPPAAAPVAPTFSNQTVRMVVRTSIGGRRIRVHLSNAFGTAPLTIGAAHVALRSKDSEIVASSDRVLLFNGKGTVMVPPGAAMISDPVDLVVPALADLAISIYVPGASDVPSRHSMALHTTYVSKEGNFTGETTMPEGTTSQVWYWVSGVDVVAPTKAAAIVAFGDSITDGATSTPNTNRSWPSLLAERLAANSDTASIAVVNQGISGNRVLSDGSGVSALARFDRDVLSVAGVQWVMILEGINDIAGASRGVGPGPATGTAPANTVPAAPVISAESLIGAMRQMIERAHTHGIKVIGCTLTPAGNVNDTGEAMRAALNTFIRSGAFDAVVDFDAITRDPKDPRQFAPGYNTTDRLHPNDAGYKAMADGIDLKIFKK